MRMVLTAVALSILVGGPVATAQTKNGTRSLGAANTSSTNRVTPEAPVGHRQPRASDIPSGDSDDPSHLNAEDAALDKQIKSICRGC